MPSLVVEEEVKVGTALSLYETKAAAVGVTAVPGESSLGQQCRAALTLQQSAAAAVRGMDGRAGCLGQATHFLERSAVVRSPKLLWRIIDNVLIFGIIYATSNSIAAVEEVKFGEHGLQCSTPCGLLCE